MALSICFESFISTERDAGSGTMPPMLLFHYWRGAGRASLRYAALVRYLGCVRYGMHALVEQPRVGVARRSLIRAYALMWAGSSTPLLAFRRTLDRAVLVFCERKANTSGGGVFQLGGTSLSTYLALDFYPDCTPCLAWARPCACSPE